MNIYIVIIVFFDSDNDILLFSIPATVIVIIVIMLLSLLGFYNVKMCLLFRFDWLDVGLLIEESIVNGGEFLSAFWKC